MRSVILIRHYITTTKDEKQLGGNILRSIRKTPVSYNTV